MHDFCFTIPYGLVVLVGGLIGYAKKASLASLGGGAAAGLLFILAGYLSLKAFEKRRNSYFALILETGNYHEIPRWVFHVRGVHLLLGLHQ